MNKKELIDISLKLFDDSKELLYLFNDELHSSESNYKKMSKHKTDLLGMFYQAWYSKCCKVIKIVLPERIDEFESFYLPPKNRKQLNALNYTISDFIIGFSNSLVRREIGLRLLYSQIDILSSVNMVINSRLDNLSSALKYEINEQEIGSAQRLLDSGYLRSAGAICGVLLEERLMTIINDSKEKIAKKNPSLGDLIQFAYEKQLIDASSYKKYLFLADIRNKCDHKKTSEPTKNEIESLIFETKRILSE